jgi:hypothetical protein
MNTTVIVRVEDEGRNFYYKAVPWVVLTSSELGFEKLLRMMKEEAEAELERHNKEKVNEQSG